jgi:hypothetical protein
MKKSILLIAVLALGASSSFAQLTTRENCATTECIGGRPVAGDMALTFGINIASDDTATLPLENNLSNGSVLTFKYYKSNDVAYRIGIRLYKTSSSFEGSTDSTTQVDPGFPGGDIFLADTNYKESTRMYLLVPGIEKHFNPTNFFDVYAGADLHLGFSRNVSTREHTLRNPTADTDNRTATTNATVVGLGGVVGFNINIAHLPIAIGLEYGWNAKWSLGGKTKVEHDTRINNVATNNTYYTQPGDSNNYIDLKRKSFAMDTNQNVRIVLNVYFSGKKSAQ